MPSQWGVIKERIALERSTQQRDAVANAFRAWAGVKPETPA
jgi:hypothetical protein